jgi:hypothetical protein
MISAGLRFFQSVPWRFNLSGNVVFVFEAARGPINAKPGTVSNAFFPQISAHHLLFYYRISFDTQASLVLDSFAKK